MEFLSNQNRINSGYIRNNDNKICAENKKVLVIGGGDTGSDCVGTAIRQKPASVTQIEILPKPPLVRTPDNPWPYYGKVLKTSTSHEEGCERIWSVSTLRFIGENNYVKGVEVEDVEWASTDDKYSMKPVSGTLRMIEADFILLALGFTHPVLDGLLSELEPELDGRKNIKVDGSQMTSIQKVFAAGDSISGASLVVNAIASGRKAAKEINKFLRS
jgi:glutamate synthase (NADPH/NADH) small chain